MSILEDFQNSSELIMEHDKHGIPLVSINDFDGAIDELKKCREAIRKISNLADVEYEYNVEVGSYVSVGELQEIINQL